MGKIAFNNLMHFSNSLNAEQCALVFAVEGIQHLEEIGSKVLLDHWRQVSLIQQALLDQLVQADHEGAATQGIQASVGRPELLLWGHQRQHLAPNHQHRKIHMQQ